MSPAVRKTSAWTLIVFLAIISGVGEGLHWIPGCGHGVEVGDAVLLLGVDVPTGPRPDDGRRHVARCPGQSLPVYDEAECAICSTAGQHYTSADSFSFVFTVPLVQDLPAAPLQAAPVATLASFQARAPPRG